MKRLALTLCLLTLSAAPALAQDKPKPMNPAELPKKAQPEVRDAVDKAKQEVQKAVEGAKDAAKAAKPDEEAMMKAWAEASTPGEMHKALAQRVGTWDMKYEMMDPMDPAKTITSTGTVTTKAIFGGRFVQSEAKGEMMGMPFEGMEITGYNNTSKQFETVWLDSMGTMIVHSTGTHDAATKTTTMTGTMDDPMTGKKMPMRYVITDKTPDLFTFDMYTSAEGQEVKMMTITYTRHGGAKPEAKPMAPGK